MDGKTIGFDFDQTLADPSKGIAECLWVVSESLGKGTSRAELFQLSISGRSLRETLSEFVDESELKTATEIFMRHYPSLGVQRAVLFPSVIELITALKQENFKIYILSAKTHENLILSLRYLNVQVDLVRGGLNASGKAKLIQELGLDFYVGDQFSDMMAATEGNCRGILVNNFSADQLPVPVYARFKTIEEFKNNLKLVLET